MPTQIPTGDSLITLSKKNPLLRYVTIKEGYQGSEIYIFKYKQITTQAGFSNNFWFAYHPDETIIVLGSETGRRTINATHCVTYLEQKTPPASLPRSCFSAVSKEARPNLIFFKSSFSA